MGIKELLKKLSRENVVIDKIWNIVWWLDVKRRLLQYSDYEFSQRLSIRQQNKRIDYAHPSTFNDKLWLLKLSNRDPLLTRCSDKHLVREYVKSCGFEDILKTEYAFFQSAKEIDFELLPSPCYLKCNHASGMNFVYRKEEQVNIQHIQWKFDFLLRQNPYFLSREWNYKNIKPGIVCEEVISMPDGSEIPELQFFCFHGIPRFLMYNIGLADKKGEHKKALRWVFDMNFTLIHLKTSQDTNDNPPTKPENFDYMVQVASELSKPFPHVRVDLFNINGKVYFNELTFYSGGGFVYLDPPEWQNIIGDYLELDNYSIKQDAVKKHKIKELIRHFK